jgi:RNA polymerase sigma-70 factor (ECF subfamily)
LSESERDLLERCRLGDQDAWRGLVSRHLRRVFAVAYRFTGRVEEAEDLVQEIFMKVFQNLSRFDGSEAVFPAWLLTLARHHAIDHVRKARTGAVDPSILESLPSNADGPDRRLEGTERTMLVHRGLRALPSELREVLVLRDLEGLSYQETAEALKIPLGTAKSRVNRGRLELARRLMGASPSREDSGGL